MIGPLVDVRDDASVSAARLLARAVANEAGLPVPLAETLAIIASELATNQVRYAGGGHLGARAITRDGVAGVEIEAVDRGPGIPDATRAFAGELRSSRSLGIGLAGVWRLALEVDVDIRAREGTRILARVFGGTVRRRPTVGVIGRGLATESRSGDTAGFWRGDDALLVMVIDGLGHGIVAREAADRALVVAESALDAEPAAMIAACSTALRGTRGAVIAVGRFEDAGGTLDTASVGNVQMGVWNRGDIRRVIAHAGIVGSSSARPPRPGGRLALPAGAALVVATDGLHDPLGGLEAADVHTLPPWTLAQRILAQHGKAHDDALVMVVR